MVSDPERTQNSLDNAVGTPTLRAVNEYLAEINMPLRTQKNDVHCDIIRVSPMNTTVKSPLKQHAGAKLSSVSCCKQWDFIFF